MCIQYNNVIDARLNDVPLLASVPENTFDVTTTCIETVLPIGLVPIHIDYASTPLSTVSFGGLHCLPTKCAMSHTWHPATMKIALICESD